MRPDWWKDIKHFVPSEFDSPDAPDSGVSMDETFMRKLDELRDMMGRPLVINSGYRTVGANAVLARAVHDSAHTLGLAADIVCPDSIFRYNIIVFGLQLGFRRFGIMRNAIHLDLDRGKPQGVIWLYPCPSCSEK